MKHRFILGNLGRSGEAPIKYEVHFGGGRFTCGTGVNIHPELWDRTNMHITKDKALIKEYKKVISDIGFKIEHVEKRLQDIKNEVNSYIGFCRQNDSIPNASDLKQRIIENVTSKDKIKRGVKQTKAINTSRTNYVIDYLEKFIYLAERGKKTISVGKLKGKIFTEGTIKNYKGLLAVLKDFQTLKYDLIWDKITMQTYNDLINYCNSKNFSQNYTGRHIKQLKSIGREAKDEGLHENRIFEDRRFATLTAPSENIYLTSADLEQISSLDLLSNKSLQDIRDIFLVGCYTAQRWSDYSKIHLGQVENGILTLIQKKTESRIKIPVKSELDVILRRHPSGFPKIAEQTFNEKLKILGKLAGLNSIYEIIKIKGGRACKVECKKFELITSHTARRTGATLMVLGRIPTAAIMKLTGHKSESSFWKYIKSSDEENAIMLQDYDYFK